MESKTMTKIEFSQELTPLFQTILDNVGDAQTAILYKYVDEKDLEITELLQLLSESPMINGDSNPNSSPSDKNVQQTNQNKVSLYKALEKKWSIAIQLFIEEYKKGNLIYDEKVNMTEWADDYYSILNEYEKNDSNNKNNNDPNTNENTENRSKELDEKIFEDLKKDFTNLKKHIKVLRFCEYYEKAEINFQKRYIFGYNKRPHKYLVICDDILNENFKIKKTEKTDKAKNNEITELNNNTKQINNQKNDPYQIEMEGITSFFCRTSGESILFKTKDENKKNNLPSSDQDKRDSVNIISNEILKLQAAHCHYSNENLDFKIYGHDAAWILLKEKCGNVIGCLRIEYDPNKIRDNKYIMQTELNIDFIISILHYSTNNRENISYDKIYNCLSPMLKSIISIGLKIKKENLEIKIQKVHSIIEHLFYVFKRNTYFGDLIYERINKFIEELLIELDLNHEIFLKLWKSLRKQEDLMLYDIENYRDHFIHQFHVFITGYIVIHNYGIEKIKELLNQIYEKKVEKIVFDEIDVIRIWALTSLYHDVGYSFEKLQSGIGVFSKELFKDVLLCNLQWDKLIVSNNQIFDILMDMPKCYNVCCESEEKSIKNALSKILIENAIIQNDHGVLSSIILKQQYFNSNMETKIKNINEIVNIASLSIALHNKPIFESLSKQYNSNICFNLNPFAYILIYSDTVQEWGRKRLVYKKNGTVYISPVLNEIWGKNEKKDKEPKESNEKTDKEPQELNEKKGIDSDNKFSFFVNLKYDYIKDQVMVNQNEINSYIYGVKNSLRSLYGNDFSIKHTIVNVNQTQKMNICDSCQELEKKK